MAIGIVIALLAGIAAVGLVVERRGRSRTGTLLELGAVSETWIAEQGSDRCRSETRVRSRVCSTGRVSGRLLDHVSDTCAGQPLDDPWFEAQHVPLVPAAAIDHVVIEHAAIDDHLQRLTMPDGRHAARPVARKVRLIGRPLMRPLDCRN